MKNWIEWTLGAMGRTEEEQVGDYDRRKIARIEREDNNGIGVSTCWVDDFECYETALIDKNGTYPVERYTSGEEAIVGHEKWVTFAEHGDGKEVTELGDGFILPDRRIILEKNNE